RRSNLLSGCLCSARFAGKLLQAFSDALRVALDARLCRTRNGAGGFSLLLSDVLGGSLRHEWASAVSGLRVSRRKPAQQRTAPLRDRPFRRKLAVVVQPSK